MDSKGDRRSVIQSYFPEFLREHQEYRAFIKIASEELGMVSDYIELFTGLVNVDTTPVEYIQSLGEMVGYSYIDDVDPNVQREIIKRVFGIHEARGDEESLLMMANHAHNSGYLGGDVFLPGSYLPGQQSMLAFPRETLFTWSKSKRSGFDKYPDGIVAVDGVIEIIVGFQDPALKTRVETVKPAGVRLFFRLSIAMSGDQLVLKVPEPPLYYDLLLEISKFVSGRVPFKFGKNARSGSSPYLRWSGESVVEFNLSTYVEPFVVSSNLSGSLLPVYYPEYTEEFIRGRHLNIPSQSVRSYTGASIYSVNAVRSGRYSRSGMKTGDIAVGAPYRRSPDLRNPVLTIGQMFDVGTDGSRNNRQTEFEVIILP